MGILGPNNYEVPKYPYWNPNLGSNMGILGPNMGRFFITGRFRYKVILWCFGAKYGPQNIEKSKILHISFFDFFGKNTFGVAGEMHRAPTEIRKCRNRPLSGAGQNSRWPYGVRLRRDFFAKFPLAPRGARFNFAKKVAPPSLAPRGARDGGATFFLRVLY